MVRASYFRRRAKSPLFSRSVGGKYYVGELASWIGHWGGPGCVSRVGVGARRWHGFVEGEEGWTCTHVLFSLLGV